MGTQLGHTDGYSVRSYRWVPSQVTQMGTQSGHTDGYPVKLCRWVPSMFGYITVFPRQELENI